MKKVLVLIFVLLPFMSFAREVKGELLDSEGLPIPLANVVLLQDSLYVDGTTTDDKGLFNFSDSAPAANFIKISKFGYEECLSPLPADGNIGTISLKEAATQLDEVVVRSNLPQTRLKGNALVTDVQNSTLSKIGNAFDVLSHIPMVTGINGELNVFGRGTPTIYINGRKVRNLTDLQQLKSEDIRSVELITNPGAAYASNVNAVIKIKTLPPKGEGFGFDITNTLNAWSYARNTTDINMRYRHNSFEVFGNLYINEGKRKYEDISKITTFSSDTFLQSIYNHSTLSMHSLFGKIGFSYMLSSQHSIGAYYRFGRSKWDNRGGIETESSIVNDKAATTVENTSGLYTSTAKDYPSQEANVYYNGKIGELSLDFNADFMQDRSDNHENHRDFLPGNDTPERNVYVDGLTKNRLLAEKLTVSYPVGKGSLEVGEEYTDSRLSYDYDYAGAPIGDSFTDINERNFAGFATLSQTFGKWNVSVGLRYEYAKYQYHDEDLPDNALSRTYNNLFPSLSMSTKLGKVRLSLDFSTRMKRPSYRKLDGRVAYLNRYVYQSGNPLLKPTKGYNVQAMATWKYFYAVLTYNHEVDAVFNTTHDSEEDPMVKVITYMNVPHYQYVQLYVGAQPTFGCWQPSPAIGMLKQFCTLNYRGVETSFNKPMYFFTLGNIFSLPKSWQIGADLWLYSAANSQNCYVKPIQQLSLSIRKSFFNDNLMLQLKGVDLLDRATNRVTIYSGDIKNYMYTHHEPRNITFTIRYMFNQARSKYKGTGAGSAEKRRM